LTDCELLKEREKKTYFLTLKKLLSSLQKFEKNYFPLCEKLFSYNHKYTTDGATMEHIKLF
jgi:hypothetical protein